MFGARKPEFLANRLGKFAHESLMQGARVNHDFFVASDPPQVKPALREAEGGDF
jgi:hypothetical protein